jgi:hypothetical protein
MVQGAKLNVCLAASGAIANPLPAGRNTGINLEL